MNKTWAIRFHEIGGPDVLRWEEVEVPRPGAGEVLLRNTAIGVNMKEIGERSGAYPCPALPDMPGIEAAAVVLETGPGVTELVPGDRVGYATTPTGSYCQERVLAADRLVKLPADIDDITVAAGLHKGMTARYLVRKSYAVRPGDTILVHAAAGGTGLLICQWAKHLGATIIGTVSTAAKGEVAHAHGCDHIIVYDGDSDGGDFAARVRELTDGRGVAAVYDSVGRDTFEGSLACLRPRGVLASFGEASGDPPPIAPRRLGILGSIYITHPSLPDYTATRAALLANAAELFAMVAGGTIKIDSSQSYPLADAARAHADIESRRTTGSVVLIP